MSENNDNTGLEPEKARSDTVIGDVEQGTSDTEEVNPGYEDDIGTGNHGNTELEAERAGHDIVNGDVKGTSDAEEVNSGFEGDVGTGNHGNAFSDLDDLADDTDLDVALPDAIDLVLKEIGEPVTDGPPVDGIDESPDSKGVVKRKLKFDVDVRNEKEMEEPSCSNPIYRYKVMDTLFLFWNTTTMGWVYGQMGPALPDLQLLAGVQLQQATWLFTGFAIGYLGGCLLSGLLQDRCNPRLMLFLYTLGTAITSGLLPWIPVFIPMVIIRVVTGVCIGGQDTGLHSMLFAIWAKEGGPFIQMTHCLSALGGILAPLITQPFLQETADIDSRKSHQVKNTTDLPFNVTNTSPVNQSTISSMTTEKPFTNKGEVEPETNIQYAFLITGILVLSASIPFLVTFLSKRHVKKAARQYSNESLDKNMLPKKIKILMLVIIFINSFIATAYIDLFPSFLVTFVLEQVQWNQKSASTLTSVYFGTYGVGNFIGVFILAYITSTKLILFSYISSGIMMIGILLSILFNQTELIWITVALAGITMSSILPTLFTWTQENVTPITGRLASGLLISGSAGVMVNPLLLGYMMDIYSPMWFIYLSLGETVVCMLLFVTVLTLSRIYSAAKGGKSGEYTIGKTESPVHKKAESPVRDSPLHVDDTSSVEKVEIYPRGTFYGV